MSWIVRCAQSACSYCVCYASSFCHFDETFIEYIAYWMELIYAYYYNRILWERIGIFWLRGAIYTQYWMIVLMTKHKSTLQYHYITITNAFKTSLPFNYIGFHMATHTLYVLYTYYTPQIISYVINIHPEELSRMCVNSCVSRHYSKIDTLNKL